MDAEIIIEYDDVEVAESIANAVSPDNYGAPTGLSINTRTEQAKVVTRIKCRSLSSFIATIDDLLFSIATAEKTLRDTRNLIQRKEIRV